MARNSTYPPAPNNSRRPSSMIIPRDNQLAQDNYDFEFMRLMEEERQLLTAHRLAQREKAAVKLPQQQPQLQRQHSQLQLHLQQQQQPQQAPLQRQHSQLQLHSQQQPPQAPLQRQQSQLQLHIQQQQQQVPLQRRHSQQQLHLQQSQPQAQPQAQQLSLQQQAQLQLSLQQSQSQAQQLALQQQAQLQLVQQQVPQPQIQAQQQQQPQVQLQQQHQQPQLQQQYFPSTDDRYANNQAPLNSMISRRLLPFPKPLRIIIIRHAERADAVLGSDWSKKSFDRGGRYIRFSEHLPDALPARSYLHHYVIDVPLTNRGRMHAFKTGKALLFNGYAADICYTSPSLRCVQSADGILSGMDRKAVPMQLEPGLFECYLNDFKRTLCFMTKDELAANNYNIDKSYQSLMPFMRPHDSQLDYYERCRLIMDVITERHQSTGGTVLIVAHAPSLEGLTRHLSGGKLQPEKLFDIARRVPFLAMTIVEKTHASSPWLFRTQPLQTNTTQATTDAALEITKSMTQMPKMNPPLPPTQPKQQQQQQVSMNRLLAQNLRDEQQAQRQIGRSQMATGPVRIDPKKVVKSSTAPNLPTSNSLSEMFRVI